MHQCVHAERIVLVHRERARRHELLEHRVVLAEVAGPRLLARAAHLLRYLHLLLRLGAELLQILDRTAPPQRVEAVLLARRRVRARVLGVGGAVVLVAVQQLPLLVKNVDAGDRLRVVPRAGLEERRHVVRVESCRELLLVGSVAMPPVKASCAERRVAAKPRGSQFLRRHPLRHTIRHGHTSGAPPTRARGLAGLSDDWAA